MDSWSRVVFMTPTLTNIWRPIPRTSLVIVFDSAYLTIPHRTRSPGPTIAQPYRLLPPGDTWLSHHCRRFAHHARTSSPT